MTLRVATITSVHNGAKTLDVCFQSLANQTRPSDEVIVIDDASTDATPYILREWQNKLSLTIITNEINLGLTKSLNRGIAATQADFIARIDIDDVWHPKKLAKQLAFFAEHPETGVVGTWYQNKCVNQSGQLNQVKQVRTPSNDNQIRQRIWHRNPFGHSCVVIKSVLLKQMDGYDETFRYAQDRDLWFRLLLHTQFANLPEYLVTRTVGPTNIEKQRDQMKINIRLILKYAKEYHPSPLAYLGLIEPSLLYYWRSLQNYI